MIYSQYYFSLYHFNTKCNLTELKFCTSTWWLAWQYNITIKKKNSKCSSKWRTKCLFFSSVHCREYKNIHFWTLYLFSKWLLHQQTNFQICTGCPISGTFAGIFVIFKDRGLPLSRHYVNFLRYKVEFKSLTFETSAVF